jgi:hypothetical protein
MVMQQLLHNTADTSSSERMPFSKYDKVAAAPRRCSWSNADKNEHDNDFSVDRVYRLKGAEGCSDRLTTPGLVLYYWSATIAATIADS